MLTARHSCAQVARRSPSLPSTFDLGAAERERIGRVDAQTADVEPSVRREGIACGVQRGTGQIALLVTATCQRIDLGGLKGVKLPKSIGP